MRTNPDSCFFNPRVFLALAFCSVGAVLAVFSVASAPPNSALADPMSCTAPGTLIISDPAGDQNGAPAANQQFDIQSVSIAEPCLASGVDSLVVTIKVANLSSIPANGHWKVTFVPPTLPAMVTAYFVEMTSDQNGSISYGYGTVGTPSMTLGTAADGSFSADGTIKITVANSKVGNPAIGQTLTKIQGQTQLLVGAAGTGLLAGMDSTTANGTNPRHSLFGHASCTWPA